MTNSLQPTLTFNAKDLLLWVLVIVAGGALAGFLEGAYFQFFATLVLMGIFVGSGGWLVLRRPAGMSILWVGVTALLWFLSFTSFVFLGGLGSTLYERFGLWEVFWLNLVDGLAVGLLWGVGQWFLLRGRTRRAWVWIPISIVAGGLHGGLGASMCAAACDGVAVWARGVLPGALARGMPLLVVESVAWLGYATLTGVTLLWLSGQTPSSAR